jgi:hypothetical protein
MLLAGDEVWVYVWMFEILGKCEDKSALLTLRFAKKILVPFYV